MISVKRLTCLVPLVALLLAACGNNRATEVGDPNSDFYVALPRIELSIDANGVPSLANVDPQLISLLTGGSLDLSQFAIDKSYVDWLVSADVQHMEIVHKGDGLFIFVNNKPLPHVGWNGDSIKAVGDSTADIGMKMGTITEQQARVIKTLMPFLRRLGVDLAVHFPLRSGASAIPLRAAGGKIDAIESTPGNPLAQVKVVVSYDDSGVPSVAGLSTQDIADLTGMDVSQLNLAPEMIKSMSDLGVQHLSMKTDKDGVLLAINDKQLPSIVWNDELLKNSADLVSALNTYEGMDQINSLVQGLVPQVKNANVELALRFPVGKGAKVNSPIVTFHS